MQLEYKEMLTRQDLSAILTLTDAAEATDGFHTSVQKDVDEDFPCFFLMAYDEDCSPTRLAGFFSCMLYTDPDELEPDDLVEASITLLVHPDYRRRHLGTELLHEGNRRCKRFAKGAISFETTINADSDGAAAFAKSLDFSIISTQLMMSHSAKALQSIDSPEMPDVTIRPCHNKRLLASIYRSAFPMSATASIQVMDQTLSDPHVTAFLCEIGVEKKQPAGMCMLLSYSSKKSYLFNIVVSEPYQRRHLATAMILHTAASLPSDMQVHLQVDAENEPAVCCYKKLGFQTVQAVREVEGIL